MSRLKNIAILGTGSDVGKSIVTAAICRSMVDKGYKVAPFKAQNMSNNSGVTPDGMEMGRAQIVQAEAARIVPHVNMNPILLKPSGEKESQVILNGVVHETLSAMSYHKNKSFYFQQACEAFKKLEAEYDMIVLEGAGSCAEVNLMPTDIVNFKMAQFADADVLLVADIHRGGVFAQIVGTLECLPAEYQKMIKGIIINRFRGDRNLFKDGVDWIETKTGKKVLGVLPWFSDFKIEDEDSVVLEKLSVQTENKAGKPAIGIIQLPHISNFTDFHVLTDIEDIQMGYINQPMDLSRFNAIILPGSKNTRADLVWLYRCGLGSKIKEYAARGGHVMGICGGYQMLGKVVQDPQGLEGEPGDTKGLNLLDVSTVLKSPKTTTLTEFIYQDIPSKGYEIHMGTTRRIKGKPFLKVLSRNSLTCSDSEGSVSEDNRIFGTYLHGFFDHCLIIEKWLASIGIQNVQIPQETTVTLKEKNYQRLKEHFEAHVRFPIEI